MLLVFLLVIPAFGLVLYGNLEQRRIETARVRESAAALSRLAAANVSTYVRNSQQWLSTLAHLPFLVLTTNRSFCELHFANLLKLTPDYSNFGLIERDGTIFCHGAHTNTAFNLGDRGYFRRVLQTRRFTIGDLQIGRLTTQPGLNFGFPVLDDKGDLRRVLFAALNPLPLSDCLGQIPIPAGGAISVMDRAGAVVARSPEPEKWVGRKLFDSPSVQRLLAEKDGVFEMPGDDGVHRLHAVTSIRDGQSAALFVAVEVPRKSSFAAADAVLARNLLVLGSVGFLVLVGARLYAERNFLQPINALAAAANRLAEGDLSARSGNICGTAELVKLGWTFDQMAERLQARRLEIERAHDQIQRLNEDLERRVTERTLQLEVANKELEAFSYSVSHDLRAPLRHINGFAGMLREYAGNSLDAKASHYLNTISDAAKSMARLIDDLLVFSRSARTDVNKTTVDLEALVQQVINTLEADLQHRKIRWQRGPLPKVEADPSLLRQALINLLDNAVKYTRPRDPAQIEIGCSSQTADETVIFIRDNGVGFDMEYAHKLFGVFQRLHRADEFEGTGIGLANARRIVLRHGGRIWAEAKLGEGATFYVALPNGRSTA